MTAILSEYKDYAEPSWIRGTVERLLSSLPEGHIHGLSAVVLTERAVATGRNQARRARGNRRRVALGRYHAAWNAEPAWIELIVDDVVMQIRRPFDRLQIARDIVIGRVLSMKSGTILTRRSDLWDARANVELRLGNAVLHGFTVRSITHICDRWLRC